MFDFSCCGLVLVFVISLCFVGACAFGLGLVVRFGCVGFLVGSLVIGIWCVP